MRDDMELARKIRRAKLWIRVWQAITLLGILAIIVPIALSAAMPGDDTTAEIVLGVLVKGALAGCIAIVWARQEIRAWKRAIRDLDGDGGSE